MVFKNLCILVIWTKVALALEELNIITISVIFLTCVSIVDEVHAVAQPRWVVPEGPVIEVITGLGIVGKNVDR